MSGVFVWTDISRGDASCDASQSSCEHVASGPKEPVGEAVISAVKGYVV